MKVKNIILVGLRLFFIPIFCLAQSSNDTIWIKDTSFINFKGDITTFYKIKNIGTVQVSVPDTMVVEYDTIKILMLITDTSAHGHYRRYIDKDKTEYFIYTNLPNICEWLYGYDVREKKEGYDNEKFESIFGKPEPPIDNMPMVRPPVNIFRPKPFYYKHIFYLNENKQPLSKSIIVWQSQSIK